MATLLYERRAVISIFRATDLVFSTNVIVGLSVEANVKYRLSHLASAFLTRDGHCCIRVSILALYNLQLQIFIFFPKASLSRKLALILIYSMI